MPLDGCQMSLLADALRVAEALLELNPASDAAASEACKLAKAAECGEPSTPPVCDSSDEDTSHFGQVSSCMASPEKPGAPKMGNDESASEYSKLAPASHLNWCHHSWQAPPANNKRSGNVQDAFLPPHKWQKPATYTPTTYTWKALDGQRACSPLTADAPSDADSSNTAAPPPPAPNRSTEAKGEDSSDSSSTEEVGSIVTSGGRFAEGASTAPAAPWKPPVPSARPAVPQSRSKPNKKGRGRQAGRVLWANPITFQRGSEGVVGAPGSSWSAQSGRPKASFEWKPLVHKHP